MVMRIGGFRIARLFRPFNRMAGSESGVAAIEFALILPLMLTLYLGGNEFGHAFTLKRKVTHTTSSIADLVTQSRKITDADMENILNAAEEILWPYESAPRIIVTLINIDEDNEATVVWSDARNDTALTPGDPVEIPDSINTADTYVLSTEVHVDHTPALGYVLTGTLDLTDHFFLRPRQGATIQRPDA
jgi:Flp pilus assembly protein TadG